MKNISKIALLTLLTIGLGSCKKFLEKDPIGRIGKQVLFEDVNGATLALNGSYKSMLNYYKAEFGMYGDVASDNLTTVLANDVYMPEQFNFSSTPDDEASAAGHIWLAIFESLNNVNNLINALPELKTKFPDQTAQLETIQGQALVLRALCHLDLTKVFAQPYNFTPDASHLGVPILLKTPTPGQEIPRKTMKETYDQILKDINDALPLLQKYNNTNQAVVSYQTALALLSRINLYKGDWAQSVTYADQVIAGNTFKLATATEYKNVFIAYPSPATTPRVEVLFQLSAFGLPSYSTTDINSIFSSFSSAKYRASTKLLNSFDVTDIRKTEMFVSTSAKSITKKYADTIATAPRPFAVKVIRLSEVYLNRAEANWNLGKYELAAEDLRIISQRAHPGQTIAISYTNNANLYKQIADERNRELCFEGHRLFDIVRRKEGLERGADCNSTICKLTYPNDKFVLPITNKELDANKAMKQNPGYN
ncbi:RagB/SusD family nutrient uptake outer membrane protein [Pedobacter sp. GR22-6]|uniref:RagB/SusD family nutrient uptake outer membrane protein n=1 Tax=Pedobacter sp. GR22-6 TaxID=3127957 RepID=UPI00307D57CE